MEDQLDNVTSTSYNQAANVESYTSAEGGKFSFTYDESGESVTDSVSQSTTQENADAGFSAKTRYTDTRVGLKHLPTCRFDSEDREIFYKYDDKGNLINVKLGAKGNLDAANAPPNKTLGPDACKNEPNSWASEYSYTYNGHGLVATIKDGINNKNFTNNITNYTYDSLGQLQQVSYPKDSSGANILTPVSYTYDSLSRVKTMTDANGQTIYDYDALGRLARITYRGGTQIIYTYDGNGNMTQRNDAVGRTTFTYTRKNELKSRSSSGRMTVQLHWLPSAPPISLALRFLESQPSSCRSLFP